MPEALVRVEALEKHYPLRGQGTSILRSRLLTLRAVDKVSFDVRRGEILGLVGESGCGKTTTGKLLCRLDAPSAGSVRMNGSDIFSLKGKELLAFRRKVQMIFQDPYESLDPRLTVGRSVREALDVHRIGRTNEEKDPLIRQALEDVGLTPAATVLEKHPHQLSGGQRQRVAIARAAVLQPQFVVADEPVSMLDMSVRAGILNLMLEFRRRHGASILFITHDLASARYMCDRIAVMYLGRIVELGPAEAVVENPQHPYTRILLSSVPEPDPERTKRRIVPKGEPPRQGKIPGGCRFHPRCPIAAERCPMEEPSLQEVQPDHFVACFFPGML